MQRQAVLLKSNGLYGRVFWERLRIQGREKTGWRRRQCAALSKMGRDVHRLQLPLKRKGGGVPPSAGAGGGGWGRPLIARQEGCVSHRAMRAG